MDMGSCAIAGRSASRPSREPSAGADLHAISAQRLGPVERGIGIGEQPVGDRLQVRLVRGRAKRAATPTETVRCARSLR